MRKILLSALLLLPLLAFSGAAYAEPHEVCATSDFPAFVEKFMTLSAEEQYTCVQYPARHLFDENMSFQNQEELQGFLGEGKFVFSPKDFGSPKDTSAPYISTAEPNKIQPAKTGYIYRQQPEGLGLSMANGGTSVMNEIRWAYVDGHWLAVSFTGWIDD